MRVLSKEEVRIDIELNRNHSWIQEILDRHKNEMDRPILDYFGNEITYSRLKEEAEKLAFALKKDGVKKGDEFIVFADRTPEYVYSIAAASILGANVILCNEHFQQDYLMQIFKQSNPKVAIIQDYKLSTLAKVLDEYSNTKVVTFSHSRSLKNEEVYKDIFDRYYNHDFSVNGTYTDYDSYVAEAPIDSNSLYEKMNIEMPFTTTYSSGTTKEGYAKGIVHNIKHYITMGRYHDPEVAGLPSLKNYSTYSNIPSYSISYLLSTLSDNLILGGKVILDPIDDPEYFMVGMKIHKSNVNIATTSTWLVNAANYYTGKVKINELSDALFPFAAGEGLSAGEEKFLNKFMKKVKAGTAISHTPVSVAKFSTAGADCEHGSLFLCLFRGILNNMPYRIGRKDPIGMKVYDFAEVKVLHEDGTYCRPLEHGRLVANSPCSMIGYSHNEEATKNFYITDAYGKTWGDMNVYGYVDEKGYVTMKGRYTKDVFPTYLIADEILKDTKKIMSCEVVSVPNENGLVYVAHIMPQYGTSFNENRVLKSAIARCKKQFGEEIQDVLYFRIHSLEDNFEITSSAKRNNKALVNEGLEKAIKYEEISDNNKIFK